jgi:hypothetical protein
VVGGTAVTPIKHDSNNTSLPAQITATLAPTVTGVSTFFDVGSNSDEHLVTNHGFPAVMLAEYAFGSVAPYNNDYQNITLGEGEGFAIVQLTDAGAAGVNYNYVIVFEVF